MLRAALRLAREARRECRPMETILWLAVTVVVIVVVMMAAPYHNRIIDNRPKIEAELD
jgi:hypothetical protein